MAGNELQAGRLEALPTGLFPLDLDFDYECPSKRKVPGRRETPHLY